MIHNLKIVTMFIVMLFVMTIVCSIGWGIVVGQLYDCTDPGFVDFLNPGDWVHSLPGKPVATVQEIVHGRSMREPDAIKQGWTVARLWYLWFSFIGVSLGISIFLSRKTWISISIPPSNNRSLEPNGRKPRRWWPLVLGIIVFAGLMALRPELASMWTRAAVAACAIVALAFGILVSSSSWE